MQFIGIDLKYIALALIFGVVCSIGIGFYTFKPQPVQVSVNQYEPLARYTPAPAPAPAITTIPVPVSTGAFDPAPAPAIVTTAPLPTITQDGGTVYGPCDPHVNQNGTPYIACIVENTASGSVGTMGFFSLMMSVCVIFCVLRMLMS